MGPQRIVRHDRPGDQTGVLRLNTLIEMLTKIAERPSLKAARADRGQVVRNKISPDLVPFIHGCP